VRELRAQRDATGPRVQLYLHKMRHCTVTKISRFVVSELMCPANPGAIRLRRDGSNRGGGAHQKRSEWPFE